jgi:ribonuclease J
MNLTFLGGVNEIGGNKILLQDRGTRIFLDFGFSFSKNDQFYSEFLQPRVCNGIGDYMDLGIIPNIDGIYRNDLLKNENRKTSKYPQVNGVFISHAHADHSWNISLLHEDMPIYCGNTCKLILKASQETGGMPYYGDFYWFRENFVDRSKKPEKMRKFHTFKTGDKFKVGNLEIEPIHVDHSLPGTYAFIVYTTSGTLAYTGDVRLHGPMSFFTQDFIKKAKEVRPDVLICEGTKIDEKERGLSEKDVLEKIRSFISNTKKLVVANYPVRDIDRFKTFYRASKENGRKLTITFKQAYLFKMLREHDPTLEMPDIEGDDIAIYAHRNRWGRFDDNDYYGWEKEFLKYKNMVTFKDIHKRQEDFVLYCDYYSINELLDVKPDFGSAYIYSTSEPHDEEQRIDFQRLKNWLKHFSLPMFEAHASGHGCQGDIKKMIEEIEPRVVIPVHTKKPELFLDLIDANKTKVRLVKVGENYAL